MINIFFLISALVSSIYSFTIRDTEGNDISLQQFQGKAILIVNIASGSPHIGKLQQLQELQQRFRDSLVVIAFPSNSFDNESRTSVEVSGFCKEQYGADFLISEKVSVKGADAAPVFKWLASKQDNGMLDGLVYEDFQMFLINREGLLIGAFSSAVSPLHTDISNAITNQ